MREREGRWMKLKLLLRLVFHWVDEVWTENLWEQEIDIKFMTVRDGYKLKFYEIKREVYINFLIWWWPRESTFSSWIVMSWRVNFFIHHMKSSLMRDVVMWRVNFSSTTWNHHHPRIYGDELERQIFIHWMNFLLLKDIHGDDFEGQIFIQSMIFLLLKRI